MAFCPACGYALSAFDKDCPRCSGQSAQQPSQPQQSPQPPQPQQPNNPPQQQQPYAGQPFNPTPQYNQQPAMPPAQQPYGQQPYGAGGAGAVSYDQPNFGYALIGFLIPLLGIILYFVYKPDRPLQARSWGQGALGGYGRASAGNSRILPPAGGAGGIDRANERAVRELAEQSETVGIGRVGIYAGPQQSVSGLIVQRTH